MELTRELDSISAKTAEVKDLTAEFEQRKFTSLLKKPLVSTGRVMVKGPRTRWETDKPQPSVTTIDGAELKVYYPKARTVEVYGMDRRMGELAASPLPRVDTLLKHFDVKRQAELTSDEVLAVTLTPREAAVREYVERIVVRIDRGTGLARGVEWTDADGERTEVTFKSPRTNTGLKQEDLELRLPPGVKVVRPLGGGKGSEGRSR